MRFAAILILAAALPWAARAGQAVDYSVDGAAYRGYSATAAGDSKGLVLIVHDWDGLTTTPSRSTSTARATGRPIPPRKRPRPAGSTRIVRECTA